jgi:3-oxoadipate enol-lactonase
MADWVGDASDIMAALDRPCHLVGVSLGSFVMARLAVTGDPRIQTVALLSTSLGFAGGEEAVKDRSDRISRDGMEAYAREYVEDTLTPYVSMEVRENVIRELGDVDPASYLDAMRITYAQDNGPVFAEVAQPTLVVVGTMDRRTPPTEAEMAARILPNSWLAVVVRAGHLIPLDQPGRVDEMLQEFWQA